MIGYKCEVNFALAYYSRYSQLLRYFTEAMGKSHSYKALIDGVNRAITDLLEVARFKEHFQIDTGLFVSRHTHWVAKNAWYESFRKTGECSVSTDQVIEAQEESHDIRHDWQTAKIVVDQSLTRAKVLEGKRFAVPDLRSAIKCAKDGDVIFLLDGVHDLNAPRPDGKSDDYFEINKSLTLSGCHPSRVKVLGNFLKRSEAALTFKRLSLWVGDGCQETVAEHATSGKRKTCSKEEACLKRTYGIFINGGNTTFVDCLIQSNVEHCIAMSGRSREDLAAAGNIAPPSLKMYHTTVEVVENTEKDKINFIVLMGETGDLTLESCYISDFFHVVSTCKSKDGNERRSGELLISNCIMYNVQNGVKVMIDPQSQVETSVTGCHIKLSTLKKEFPSIGIAQTGGKIEVKHNYLVLNSESGWETGVSLHSCARAVVSTNKIESPEDQARIWHVNTGLMLSENVATQLNLIELTGLRIGGKITNKLQEPMNKLEIGKCTFTNCSISISLDEDHLGGEVNPESGKVVVRVDEESGQVVQSPGTPKSLKVDGGGDKRPDEKTNLLCDVTNCTFETGFYGVMNQSRKTRLMVERNCFLDICKAFVISYKNLGLATTVDRNDYRFSRPYRSLAQECNSSRSKTNLKGLRDLMYTRFAIKENIPCRVAYDKACYRVITVKEDELHYIQNYQEPANHRRR